LGWTPVPTAQCSLIKDERRRVGFALLIPIVVAPELPESPVLVRQANNAFAVPHGTLRISMAPKS
jgi:hypothetical protein